MALKLLYVGDFGKTGFGTVAAGLLNNLHKTGKYDILHLAINYNDLEPAMTPWPTVPAGFFTPRVDGHYEAADPYGYTKINSYVQSFDPDITLFNNDFPVVDRYLGPPDKPTEFAKHRCKKVIYAPMDSWPFPQPFATIARRFDLVISYSYWQKDMMCVTDPQMMDIPVMYHGVDTSIYHPIDKIEAKKQLHDIFTKYNKGVKIPDFTDRYIVYFVGTNQWRKDIPALFRAYKQFRDTFPDDPMFLIPHTSANPMGVGTGGWSLFNLRDLIGLRDAVLMQNANIFNEEEMNVFYNAADVLAFPTKGEGFGLPSFEAMATKTPVIATKFGPQYEIHADGRGYFIDVEDYEPGSGGGFTYFAKPSWRSLADQLSYVYTHKEDVAENVERAYNWVTKQTWESKATQLDGILEKIWSVPQRKGRSNAPAVKRRNRK